MANSIRVKSASEYTIEVNDQGETICFDMSDTSLTSKVCRMFEKIDCLTEEYKAKEAAVIATPDETYKSIDKEEKNEETGETEITSKALITKNQYEKAKLIDEFYTDARAVMDTFLGAGACQKIFGDKNYLSMFDDLTEQLEPHFKKMGINAEKLKTSAVQKYAPNRATRRALK